MREVLREIADLVKRETGIVVRDNQATALESAVRRATGSDPQTFLRLVDDPAAGRGAIERLIDEVTVQETYFLRERGQLEAIAWRSLLQAARADGHATVRVWVAACATGEEAYTLALLAAEAFAPEPPPVDILATDVSRAALEHARLGRYRARSVQHLPAPTRDRWLRQVGNEYEVDERLREVVRLRLHNLVRDPVPPLGEERFDFVVCRNVLIYFDTPTVEQVIAALEGALHEHGTLLLGAADTLCGGTTRLAVAGAPARPPEQPREPLRRPLGREDDLLDQALVAADEGRSSDSLAAVARLLREEPLNADAYFVRGLVELESGAAGHAVQSFRRALYVDPRFGLAAFKLGRAYDAAGDPGAARRAYEQALRTLDPEQEGHDRILDQVDLGDIADACRARLAGASLR